MSFAPTMRLHLTAQWKDTLEATMTTPAQHLATFAEEIQNMDLSGDTSFYPIDVLFLEDGSTGTFSGVITAFFEKSGQVFLKTTSNDIIALTYS